MRIRQYPYALWTPCASHVEVRGAIINEPRVNDRINVSEVRLVGPGGEQVGVVRVEDALRLAREANLDLVEVAPNAKPPVAKLMDYGKFKYEAAQKAREARRNQANTQLKEIRMGLKIDQHDYETKLRRIIKFLNDGDKVKVQLRFRGREQSRPEMGVRLMERVAEDTADDGTVESAPRVDGRTMVMVLAPIRRKSEAKSDQRRRREAERRNRRAEEARRAQKNADRIASKAKGGNS
ncbi:MAG: translation initiation factor IF-3 [Actinomycetaceae bacterium]|nr:translation initiation factor IF-3 [Actinomycetaceae bacterium]